MNPHRAESIHFECF